MPVRHAGGAGSAPDKTVCREAAVKQSGNTMEVVSVSSDTGTFVFFPEKAVWNGFLCAGNARSCGAGNPASLFWAVCYSAENSMKTKKYNIIRRKENEKDMCSDGSAFALALFMSESECGRL